MRFVVVLFLVTSALAQIQPLQSHSKESLRGVSIFDQRDAWASGTHGTYLVTKDGGVSWTVGKVPGADDLDFRGVKLFHNEAFLLASGTGDKSRIYHLRMGKPWELQFTNHDPAGFFDCIAFFDRMHGIVVGDPVNGKFQILRTQDDGRSWQYSDPKDMPAALAGEGAFAASNTCIAVNGSSNVWFATGGPAARVFHSADGGQTWTVTDTPIVHGAPSQGIFTIAFRDSLHGTIAGGDYKSPEQGGANLAVTDDGGRTWKLVELPQMKFLSGAAYITGGANAGALVVVGSSATAISKDDLHSWLAFLPDGFNAVDSKLGVVFVVGADGKIAKIQP